MTDEEKEAVLAAMAAWGNEHDAAACTHYCCDLCAVENCRYGVRQALGL